MYTEQDIMTYEDFNYIEELIEVITSQIRDPQSTLWNGQSFENWDSYDTGLEWEE